MNRQPDETDSEQLHEATRDALKDRMTHVSPEVAERLAAMRRAAVAELDRRQSGRTARRPSWLWIGGMAGTAAATVLTVALLFPPGRQPSPNGLLLADADDLAAVAELDVLEELEFLAWLEQEGLDAGQG